MYPRICSMYDQNPYRIQEVSKRGRSGDSKPRFFFIGMNAMMALVISAWSFVL